MSSRRRSWSNEDLAIAVTASQSIRQTIQKLGLKEAGGNYTHVRRCISDLKLSTKHFSGQAWNRGLRGLKRKPDVPIEQILIKESTFQSYKLKKRLFALGLKPEYCEECGWQVRSPDGYLPLELDHINGDPRDNRLSNLRILCPNCHSLKPTHRGKNKKKSGW